MFSTQDVQEIFRSLPPQRDGQLLQFAISESGKELLSGKNVARRFERLMTDGKSIM
jgi:hypothetical protein